MADLREEIVSPRPWETMGMFFGYFAVAKDVPNILRMLFVPRLVPSALKSMLLNLVNSSNFWLLLFFTIFVIFLYGWLLWRPKQKEPLNKDRREKAIAVMHRYRLIRIIRSFGWIFIREKILDCINVGLYGTFRRQGNWDPEPRRFNYIDRITFTDTSGWEFQYSKDFKQIFIRTHPIATDQYGQSDARPPTWKEMGLLLFASNFFPLWLPIHLMRRPFL